MKGILHSIITIIFLTFAIAAAPLALSDEIENEVEEERQFENELEEENGLGNEIESEEESEIEHELEGYTYNNDLGIGSFDVMDDYESEEGSFLELADLDDSDSDDFDSDGEDFDSDDSDGDLDDSDPEDDTDVDPVD